MKYWVVRARRWALNRTAFVFLYSYSCCVTGIMCGGSLCPINDARLEFPHVWQELLKMFGGGGGIKFNSNLGVFVRNWSFVQKSPTACGASQCVIEKPPKWVGSGPLGAVAPKTYKQTRTYACTCSIKNSLSKGNRFGSYCEIQSRTDTELHVCRLSSIKCV